MKRTEAGRETIVHTPTAGAAEGWLAWSEHAASQAFDSAKLLLHEAQEAIGYATTPPQHAIAAPRTGHHDTPLTHHVNEHHEARLHERAKPAPNSAMRPVTSSGTTGLKGHELPAPPDNR